MADIGGTNSTGDDAAVKLKGLTLADIDIVETGTNEASLVSSPGGGEQKDLPNNKSSDSCDWRPNPKSLPYASSRSYKVDGVQTDIWVQVFQDRVLLACSQLQGKIGNWIFCKPSIPATGAPLEGNKILDLDVTVLLGNREEPMLTVYVKKILQDMGPGARPFVLGLAVQKLRDPAVFRTITHLLANAWKEAES